jgi:stage II sporulation protein D
VNAGTVFVLDGGGWGHGIGMSQWGAEGYARHGYDYRRILAHYYRHTALSSVPSRQVRVLLTQRRLRVRVASGAPFLVVDASGKKLHLAGRPVLVNSSFTLRARHLYPPLRFEPGAEPLTLGGAGYRGELVVNLRHGRLQVVNVLPLDRYLRGVVPWEVPVGWHQATYEAQAVAARSYTLAELKPGADFDLYPDQRSQMYGGIRAERIETNLAIGATAGQVLTWRGAVIPAFYFSTSGGQTSSVHDAWPRMAQVPYLVSVPDPYDSISPRHAWPTRALTPAGLGRRLGLRGVRDAVVVDNGSRHVRVVRLLTASGWKSVSGLTMRNKLKLGSTDFRLGTLRLDAPSRRGLLSSRIEVRGLVRALRHGQLEELLGGTWHTLRYVRGQFSATIRLRTQLQLRLVAEGVPGPSLTIRR